MSPVAGLVLEHLDGALRARIDEPEWTVLWSGTVAADRTSTVAPLPLEPTVALPEGTLPEATREAVRVSTGESAAVTLELASITAGRGILACLGTDGRVAGAVVRALAVPEPAIAAGADDVVVAPGVEVSAFGVERLVSEVVRLLPPDPPLADASGTTAPVRVAAEWAMLLTRAVQEDDDAMLRELAAEYGWDEVPDLLVALAEDVRANATLTMRVAGSARVGVRRWLQCRLGWVAVELDDGYLTHRLCTSEEIRDDLVFDLTGALDVVLGAAAQLGGRDDG